MPSERRSRTIAAPLGELWTVVRDPSHLARWWPRVSRVEDVREDAFTQVMTSAKGKAVRADFNLVSVDEAAHRLRWEQRVQDTPFATLLRSASTEVSLEPAVTQPPAGAAAATEVTIELEQSLRGLFPRLGAHLVRRAAGATLEEALDGLERISG